MNNRKNINKVNDRTSLSVLMKNPVQREKMIDEHSNQYNDIDQDENNEEYGVMGKIRSFISQMIQ
jgi:small subunit ribosomal protein S2